jgi:cell division transport system ATP-binding protein
MELIRIKGVEKQYQNGVTAVYDVDLKVKKGDFIFVIGASGSGKSTLIKMLYREEKPTKGQIIIGGIDVAKLRNSKVYKLRRKLGIVFQDFKLLPTLNIYENVAFALEIFGLPKNEIRAKTIKALELVGLKNKAKNFPNELSGGEQQRVAIARAIVNGPKLLLCDEPTGNLDPETSFGIMKVLEVINNLGTTIIMATHDKEMVNKMQKRVILLENGKVTKDFEKGSYDYNETV